jgi:DNA-binding transcriptional LysR family regulator
MDLKQVRTFMAVTKVGSFTKAAEILDYAQSSVSAQIQALENELGVKLFERIGRNIALTEEGKRLLIYSHKLLKLEDEAKESISGNMLPKGTIIIGAPESLSIFKLPSLLQEYRKCFPSVKLIMKLGSCRDIYEWLRKNIIDVAFLLDTPIADSSLKNEVLSHEPMMLVGGSGHFLSERSVCGPSDIANEDLILVEEECCCYRLIFEKQLAEAGVQPWSIQEFGSVEMIKKCVISGLGISILPKIAVEQEVSRGLLKDLHWSNIDFNIHTQMIYHKDKWLSPALLALMLIARDILKS